MGCDQEESSRGSLMMFFKPFALIISLALIYLCVAVYSLTDASVLPVSTASIGVEILFVHLYDTCG
jgi:hypothetical protein